MNSINKKDRRTKMIDALSRETSFPDKFAVESILKLYKDLTSKGGKIERSAFREFLGSRFKMTDEMLMDRIFKVFDQDNDSKLSEEEFVRGLSVFLFGDPEQKAKFAFEVYDLNGDGFISREEIFFLLKNCLPTKQLDEDPEEGVKDLTDCGLKINKKEHDPKISREEFINTALEDSQTTELFGPCLPRCEEREEFLECCVQGRWHKGGSHQIQL